MLGGDCLRSSDPDALACDDVGKKTERHSRAVELLQRCSVISAIWQEAAMNGIIYLIGLIVVILAILSFFGLR